MHYTMPLCTMLVPTLSLKDNDDMMSTAMDEALDNYDKDNDANLEERVSQKENSLSEKKPRTYDEIVKMSEYFRAFPKQCRKGYESDRLRYRVRQKTSLLLKTFGCA